MPRTKHRSAEGSRDDISTHRQGRNSSYLGGGKSWFILEPPLSHHSQGTHDSVSLTCRVQRGSRFLEVLQWPKKATNEDSFRVHWWRQQVGRLEQIWEVSGIGHTCFLTAFLGFCLEIEFCLVYSHIFYRKVKEVLGQTQRKDWLLKGLKVAQGRLLLGCGHIVVQTHNH